MLRYRSPTPTSVTHAAMNLYQINLIHGTHSSKGKRRQGKRDQQFSPCSPSCASLSQPSHSPTLASFCSLPLSEQEENVKTDIFAAYCTLLFSTRIVTTTSQQQKGGASDMVDTPLIFLPAQTPTIFAALSRLVRDNSSRDSAGLHRFPYFPCDCAPWGLGQAHGSAAVGTLFSLKSVEKSWRSDWRCVCVCVYVCVCEYGCGEFAKRKGVCKCMLTHTDTLGHT